MVESQAHPVFAFLYLVKPVEGGEQVNIAVGQLEQVLPEASVIGPGLTYAPVIVTLKAVQPLGKEILKISAKPPGFEEHADVSKNAPELLLAQEKEGVQPVPVTEICVQDVQEGMLRSTVVIGHPQLDGSEREIL